MERFHYPKVMPMRYEDKERWWVRGERFFIAMGSNDNLDGIDAEWKTCGADIGKIQVRMPPPSTCRIV